MKKTIRVVAAFLSILLFVCLSTLSAIEIASQSFSYVLDYSKQYDPPYFVQNYDDTSEITSVDTSSTSPNVGFFLRVPCRAGESVDLSHITVKFGPFQIDNDGVLEKTGLLYGIGIYNFKGSGGQSSDSSGGLEFSGSGEEEYETNLGTGNKTFLQHEYCMFRIDYTFNDSDFSKYQADSTLVSVVTVGVDAQ